MGEALAERLVPGDGRCGGGIRIVEIATDKDDISRVMFDLGLRLGPAGPAPPPARAQLARGAAPVRLRSLTAPPTAETAKLRPTRRLARSAGDDSSDTGG